jgi:hypothetical protein
VKRLRAARSVTQEALADQADVSRRYLQEIESGVKLPTVPCWPVYATAWVALGMTCSRDYEETKAYVCYLEKLVQTNPGDPGNLR